MEKQYGSGEYYDPNDKVWKKDFWEYGKRKYLIND